MKTQNTKCSAKNCKNECYKGMTFEYDGKDYCSEKCVPKKPTIKLSPKNVNEAISKLKAYMKKPKKQIVMKPRVTIQKYYCLICEEDGNSPLACGIYASAKEAQEAYKDIKDCPSKHKVVKCNADVSW